jgi:hyaluronate lyase
MVPSAKSEDKKAYEGMIKTWMQDDYFKNAYRWNNFKLTMPVVLEVERILKDPSIPPRPRPLGPKVFHNTDYVVYQQPGYAASLSMSSTRIATHEMMQGVNNRGWYQAEGTLFVHVPDPLRYNDDFWPTVNPYRLPGITVGTHERKPGDTSAGNQGKLSTSPWAGGVQLGDYALASMGLAAQESTLTAQKAWFFFGEQIVCLGSAIKSSDGRAIETIVENAKLNKSGDNPFVVNGRSEPATLGWSADLPATQWAFLAGSFPGASIGYVFPGGANLKALREARTGNWQALFVRDKEKGERTNNFLTLWFDHGENPADVGYAYILLPGKELEAVKSYAAKPPVEVVANSAAVQAVSAPALGLKGANFWSAGSAAGITSSGKAAVLVLEKDGKISVAVSDPTQLEKNVEVTLDAKAIKLVQGVERINVVSTSPIKLSVNLDGAYGKTLVVEFQK